MRVLEAGARAVAPWALGIALVLLLSHSPRAALVLTVSFLAAIISGLWLERVLWHVLQPGRPRFTRSLLWQAVGRMAFLMVVVLALFFIRRQVELWAVAGGVTLAVVGWVVAGLRGQ